MTVLQKLKIVPKKYGNLHDPTEQPTESMNSKLEVHNKWPETLLCGLNRESWLKLQSKIKQIIMV